MHGVDSIRVELAPPLRQAVLTSLVAHVTLAFFALFGGWLSPGAIQPPVVYSITLEGGKTLGGMQQEEKTKKAAPAPPKKVSSATPKQEEKAVAKEMKSAKDAEVSLAEKAKATPKPTPKPAAKATPPPKAKETPKPKSTPTTADINKKYESAMQRYLGESTDAGGKGFGAGRVGGNAMGGGVVRPPEFFRYKRVIEENIKSGWRWYDTQAALVAQITFRIAADGKLSDVELAASSGNSEFDASALRAVQKVTSLPPPPENVYQYFREVRMTFDPRD